MDDGSGIKARIEKYIRMFYDNRAKVTTEGVGKKTVELSDMYASDAKSFLEKKDYYTAFASIEYAHGLLDAVIAIRDENVH
jgi:hypothetical protein